MQTQITKGMIHVYGHASAEPELVAKTFNGVFTQEVHSDSDLAIFAINPSAGVDQVTIDLWTELDEFQIPRLVVVTHLEKQEADFDDAVMIANRVFSPMATPFWFCMMNSVYLWHLFHSLICRSSITQLLHQQPV